jgi:hypothetical protein
MVKDNIAKVGDLGCAIQESSYALKSPKKATKKDSKMLDVEEMGEIHVSESMII